MKYIKRKVKSELMAGCGCFTFGESDVQSHIIGLHRHLDVLSVDNAQDAICI